MSKSIPETWITGYFLWCLLTNNSVWHALDFVITQFNRADKLTQTFRAEDQLQFLRLLKLQFFGLVQWDFWHWQLAERLVASVLWVQLHRCLRQKACFPKAMALQCLRKNNNCEWECNLLRLVPCCVNGHRHAVWPKTRLIHSNSQVKKKMDDSVNLSPWKNMNWVYKQEIGEMGSQKKRLVRLIKIEKR